MAFIDWSSKLLTHIPQIDTDHRRLFELINELYAVTAEGNRDRVLSETLFNQLINYANYHFAAEEALMRKFHDPHFSEHKEVHERFRKQILEYQRQVLQEGSAVNIEMARFLRNVILIDVTVNDMVLGNFLASKEATKLGVMSV